MQGVVMAGGKGTRLQPLTFAEPKPFLPVAGRPVVEWALLSLARAGITDIVVTTAYKPEVLRRHLGEGEDLGVQLRYSEEETPLGTAGGVKHAEQMIEDTFVVMSADVVADIDVGALIEFHRARKAQATIALTHVDDPTAYGIVGMDDDGKIERFKEKPKPEEIFSDLTNAGVFVVEPSVLDKIPKDEPYDWSKDVWSNMIGEELYGQVLDGYWKDVGQPRDLIDANKHQAERVGRDRFGTVDIAPDAECVDTIIMDGCRVEGGAVVRDSLLMDGVTIHSDAVIEGTVVGRRSTIGAAARLEDCVIGEETEVPERVSWSGRREPEPEAKVQARIAGGTA